MPMLQEHLEQLQQLQQSGPGMGTKNEVLRHEDSRHEHTETTLSRKLSEESIRTELCDGPIPDSPPKSKTPEQDTTPVSDRAELIERLKRGESPTWVPNRRFESLFQQTTLRSPAASPKPLPALSPTLLPPAPITPEKPNIKDVSDEAEDRLQDGLNIERPRSALHSGDFRHDESSTEPRPSREPTLGDVTSRDRSSSHSWLATSPPRDFALDFGRRSSRIGFASAASSVSSSLSQSFAYKPPTSPLVQSESNDDLVDLSLPMHNIDIATGGYRTTNSSRRHTLNFYPSSPHTNAAASRHLTPGREGTHPYQAHQPRRSLTSMPNLALPGSSPHTPGHGFPGSRRQSLSSDASPMLHASMVGSYEESILRGRMSTTPSKPLDFQAEIGVLGLGKCKPSLKCPAHVTVPFSAVFYSYASTTHGRTISEDGPSPYVGQIDIENGLSNPEDEQRAKRKMQTRYPSRTSANHDVDMDMDMDPGLADNSDNEARKVRHSRRSRSPKAPPGGSYRIPEKGMLQVIIKNQNKTAVKLFLVRYDLAGMEPGTKTFVRQRSYSDPEDTSSSSRPILRYLIQLHICCLAKGRYYLYKSIRVVFANRVPDGKEKLRNEVTCPEPRFSPYKSTRVMFPPAGQSGGPGAMLAAEQASRRRSSGFTFASPAQYGGGRPHPDAALDGVGGSEYGGGAPTSSPFSVPASTAGGGSRSFAPFVMAPGTGAAGNNNSTVDPIPLGLPRAAAAGRVVSDSTSNASDETRDSRLPLPRSLESRPGSNAAAEARRPLERLAWDDDDDGLGGCQSAKYDKLSKGDVGYGGSAFAATYVDGAAAATEGLLSKSLRSLGVQSRPEEDD